MIPYRYGESYLECASRELHEEIGLSPDQQSAGSGPAGPLRELFTFPYEDSTCHVWGCCLTVTCPPDHVVSLNDGEVEWTRWVPLEEVRAMIRGEGEGGGAADITPVGRHILQLYFEKTRRRWPLHRP
jgi:8-oxo-dGTP pyrophosphatase MutT (NUDIX family)